MKNLAIITARSGSKGLVDKNIKLLKGHPLLAYSIIAAKESGLFDEIMVSTDSQKYAGISKKYGANVPFLRSEKTSGDRASSWDVVKEVLQRYKELGKEFDNVFLLQPTSPLRESEDLMGAYDLFCRKNANYVVSVCEMDHSPIWSNVLPEDLCLENFINKQYVDVPRQQLPIFYRLNGAIYIIKTKYLLEKTDYKLMDKNSYAYIMSKDKSIDIDDELDFIIAEAILNKNNYNNK